MACSSAAAGESLMLSDEERERLAGEAISAAAGLTVAVNAGAQTTVSTVRLAGHAAAAGADAIAVAPPPFFAFDDESLLKHFRGRRRRIRSGPVLSVPRFGNGRDTRSRSPSCSRWRTVSRSLSE